MRVLHLTDLHITDGPYLDDQRQVVHRIRQLVRDAEPDLALLTGDLTGHEAPHRSTPAERVLLHELVDELAATCPVVVVQGNHDDETDLRGLSLIGGADPVPGAPGAKWPVRVFTRAETIEVETRAGPCCVAAMPYPSRAWLLAEGLAPGQDAHSAACDRMAALLRSFLSAVIRGKARRPDVPWVVAAHVHVAGGRAAGGEVLRDREIEISAADLEDLPADYLALGHLHVRQAATPRAWYAGSPWPTKFSEKDTKGVQVVDIGLPVLPWPKQHRVHGVLRIGTATHAMGQALHAITIRWADTGARRRVTLEYRRADAGGEPGWTQEPTSEELAAVDGAVVRMRLVVPSQHLAGCPWPEAQAAVRQLHPHHLVVARTVVEPRQREVRAPEIATADSVEDKVRAYWSTLRTPPTDAEREQAMGCLAALQDTDDETLAALGV